MINSNIFHFHFKFFFLFFRKERKMFFGEETGSAIASGIECASHLGRTFNFKLGCFAAKQIKCREGVQPLVELKTRWRFCTFGCSLSLDEQLILFLLQSLKKKNVFLEETVGWPACFSLPLCYGLSLDVPFNTTFKKEKCFWGGNVERNSWGITYKSFFGQHF